MKKVYLLAVVAAVLFGALMFLFLQGSSKSSDDAVEMKTVVAATCDIAADVTITDDMVKEQQVPASSVQVNALSSKADVVGKCCPAQIVKGEQLMSNMLADPTAAGSRLAAQLKDGMRAMTVEVEMDAGVGGYVTAGDRVDLLGLVLDGEGAPVATTEGARTPYNTYVIVENIEVLRVGEASKEGQNTYSYLTLSLTEDQCKAVYAYQAAQTSGSTFDFHVVLRSVGGAQ